MVIFTPVKKVVGGEGEEVVPNQQQQPQHLRPYDWGKFNVLNAFSMLM